MTKNPERYLDDLVVGEVWDGEPFEITEADIVEFGAKYDPQPFHTDAEAAAAGPFGGLIASGWHLNALIMREFVHSKPYGDTPILGMGVDELRWLHPVRPGDRLRIHAQIVEVKRSSSRPDRGMVRTAISATNQDGVPVIRLQTLTQMPARPAATGG